MALVAAPVPCSRAASVARSSWPAGRGAAGHRAPVGQLGRRAVDAQEGQLRLDVLTPFRGELTASGRSCWPPPGTDPAVSGQVSITTHTLSLIRPDLYCLGSGLRIASAGVGTPATVAQDVLCTGTAGGNVIPSTQNGGSNREDRTMRVKRAAALLTRQAVGPQNQP
jgi:hypothetical protein